MKKISFAFGFLCLALGVSAQSLTPAWVARYQGIGDNSDVHNKIISDGSGGFIAVGYTVRSGNYKDMLVVKLNSSLDTVWTLTKNGKNGGDDVAIAATVDGSGNIYVTGYIDAGNTGDDAELIKYDANGNTVWDTSYYSTTNAFLDDHPVAISMLPSGNIVIAGWTAQSTKTTNANDMLVLCYIPYGGLV